MRSVSQSNAEVGLRLSVLTVADALHCAQAPQTHCPNKTITAAYPTAFVWVLLLVYCRFSCLQEPQAVLVPPTPLLPKYSAAFFRPPLDEPPTPFALGTSWPRLPRLPRPSSMQTPWSSPLRFPSSSSGRLPSPPRRPTVAP